MARSKKDEFKIVIDSAILLVKKIIVSPSLREAHLKASFNYSTYKYALRKMKTLYFTCCGGKQDLSLHNVINGRLPKRAVLGLVRTESFHGVYQRCPFNFLQLSITNVTAPREWTVLSCDGGLEIDPYKGRGLQGYWSLLQTMGNFFTNTDIDINLWNDYFVAGDCLFAFDFSAEMQGGSALHFDLVRRESWTSKSNWLPRLCFQPL